MEKILLYRWETDSLNGCRNVNIFGFRELNHKPANIILLLHHCLLTGSSVIAKYKGQMLYFEDLKIGIPLVFQVNEMLFLLAKSSLFPCSVCIWLHHKYLQCCHFDVDRNDEQGHYKSPCD